MKLIFIIIITLFVFTISPNVALAESAPISYQDTQDSPIGTRNSTAPIETAEFDFLIGDWDVVITWCRMGGPHNSA